MISLRRVVNPIEWLAWIYGKFFVGHPIIGYLVLCGLGAGLIAILWIRAVDKYNEQHTRQNEIDFLPPYQAASTDTPDGGPNVSIWWIPVKLTSGHQRPLSHATVSLKLHNAHLINHSENQTLWWVDKKDRSIPEITLVPERVHMINFVARRVPPSSGDDKGWYAVLVEQQHSSTYPGSETVKLPTGDGPVNYKLTVTVLASGKPMASNTYIVHVPPKGEHNTRFWIATEQTDNW